MFHFGQSDCFAFTLALLCIGFHVDFIPTREVIKDIRDRSLHTPALKHLALQVIDNNWFFTPSQP